MVPPGERDEITVTEVLIKDYLSQSIVHYVSAITWTILYYVTRNAYS